MPYFNIVAETNENTVVTKYEPVKQRSDSYQSDKNAGGIVLMQSFKDYYYGYESVDGKQIHVT